MAADPVDIARSPAKSSALALLFSFRGRLGRTNYWLVTSAQIFTLLVFYGLAFITVPNGQFHHLDLLLLLPLSASFFAVTTKRLHDRGRSVWWLLPLWFLPVLFAGFAIAISFIGPDDTFEIVVTLLGIAFPIWAFIELYVLRGSFGPNHYGPEPVEGFL
jgi:uncharacterized membrane protein YhaH (DUF805 family)